jgi:hypothetical protein
VYWCWLWFWLVLPFVTAVLEGGPVTSIFRVEEQTHVKMKDETGCARADGKWWPLRLTLPPWRWRQNAPQNRRQHPMSVQCHYQKAVSSSLTNRCASLKPIFNLLYGWSVGGFIPCYSCEAGWIYHALNCIVGWNGGIASYILNLDIRWSWVLIFTTRPLLPPGVTALVHIEGWTGTRGGLDAVWTTKISCLFQEYKNLSAAHPL